MSQVFITGGAKRIGRALSLAFAERGYDVAIHYNSSHEEALELVSEIKKMGVDAKSYCADLRDELAVKEMFLEVLRDFPSLNTIINNASIFPAKSLKTGTVDEFLENYAIHVVSPITLIQLFTSHRKEGTIINILDSKVTTNSYKRAPYLLAKKALLEMTKMAALEFAPHFRINGISPGYVLDPSDNSKQFTPNINPLQKKISLENLISTVMFLLGNEDMTGQILNIDGGERL